jgi:predicted Zn-dependent protease
MSIPVSHAYNMLSREWEVELGDRFNMDHNPNVVTGTEGNVVATLQSITSEVLKVTPNRVCSYDAQVLKSNDINAFTVPNGHIYVTFPMMKFVKTYDELAFVVGHEIAHEQKNHYLDTAEKMAEERFGIAMWDWQRVKTKVHDFAYAAIPVVLDYGYGDKREKEADAYAFVLLGDSNYNVAAGAIFFRRVIRESYDLNLQNYRNAHKDTELRLKRQLSYLKYWSHDKVEVIDDAILINGVFITRPDKNYIYDNYERTYYIAGGFAHAFHENPNATFQIVDGEKIQYNGQTIIKPTGNDEDVKVIYDRVQMALQTAR